MRKCINEQGNQYGRLVVLERAEKKVKNGQHASWRCKCSCGKEVIVQSGNLRSGKTRSCGCLLTKETNSNYRHGGCLGGHTRLYRILNGMKVRCYNSNRHEYKWYGGKGIQVCNEWLNDFVAFRDWSYENGYTDNLTIDRVDSDGNYEPGNCQWITGEENTKKARIKNKLKGD